MPNDLPPWYVVYQQTQRWFAADCVEALVDDLRLLLREAKERNRHVIFERHTSQLTIVPAIMEPNDAKAAKSTSQWIL